MNMVFDGVGSLMNLFVCWVLRLNLASCKLEKVERIKLGIVVYISVFVFFCFRVMSNN